jgi:hypothetical protein
MSGTMHEGSLMLSMESAIRSDPRFAIEILDVRQRMLDGFYKPDALVDAIGSPTHWSRHDDLLHAYGFMLMWCHIMSGQAAVRYVDVGHFPSMDKSREPNRLKLQNLSAPFSARVWDGGRNDDDGCFSWSAPIEVNRDGSGVELYDRSGSVPLEIGETRVSRTLLHFRSENGVARWPYEHDKIVLILRHPSWPRHDFSLLKGRDECPQAVVARSDEHRPDQDRMAQTRHLDRLGGDGHQGLRDKRRGHEGSHVCSRLECRQGGRLPNQPARIGYTMTETCTKCRRVRPEYIADPCCMKGGYCVWSETETVSKQQQEAAGHLLAAEADLLRACGWVPLVVGGKLRWRNDHGETLCQSEAIDRQKRRMNISDNS